ncbi:hypothetical protein D0B54_08605 [Solimonas sp. K1W22B-7]|uniref:alcohol dehydrogenase catalytic domain-containing protein n=1 Tax=Solimonas sp. K1W22B-7 TaxID=2303331 RepID=UPI000E33150D|nr:zinc-binding dehydrogenase [Solimonas sp. K1W22B-7]AXQ28739.1 hypothetical protein D0B54_08605 [Solimonas sp. K1W22B-7]
MNASWLGPIGQISYSTGDLDRTLAFWERQVGVGPWSVYRGLTLVLRYEGRQIALPFDVALAMHGDQLIELIQVRGDGPSPFHDALNRPIIGLQRLASVTAHYERDRQAAIDSGLDAYAEGIDPTGQRYVYFRSPEAPGVILELLESIPSFEAFRSRLEARARGYARAAAAPATAETAVPTGTRMKAALLHAYGEPGEFRIEDVAVPEPGPGEIRVRVAAAAVNPVDVKARRGYLKDWMPLEFPARLGGDVSGVVEALGAGVSLFRIGDRVMGMINPMAHGAYAECVVSAAAAFAQLPEGLDLVRAAALPTGVLTGTQLIERGVRPKPGDRGLVIGAGGSTGRAAVFAALDAGAKVYAGVRASSLDAVRDLPLAGVIDLDDAAALTAAGPFDFVADTVGGETAEKLFAHLRGDGVFASTAFPPPNPPPASTQRFTSLVVSFDGPRLQRFARELAEKNRQMPVARQLPLAAVIEAHQLMEQGAVGGKILLLP